MTNYRPDDQSGYTDIQDRTWFDALLPGWSLPYTRLMRLDRPIGAYLLFIPGLWGVLLASIQTEGAGLARALWIIALLFAGSVIMRGAGCVINDMWDRDLDRQVERTAGRPLASGAIRLREAFVFLALLLGLGLLILVQMKPLGIALGVLSLVPVILYPLAKRFTDFPQAVLGLTFNFGALIGWAAIAGSLSAPMILLYLGCIAWTFGYDTVYAHQDKSDDAIIGVRSTALAFGTNSKTAITLSYAVAAILWSTSLLLVTRDTALYVGLAGVLMVAVRMIWTLYRTDLDNPAACLKTFKGEQWTGWILGLVLALAWILDLILA